MGTNTKVSLLNWISTRKTYSQGYDLIKYIKYILVSKYMKLSRNKNSGLVWLNTLVQYYVYNTLGKYYVHNTLENYYVYNTLEPYWFQFCKMVPAFQYNKVDVMGIVAKRSLDILSGIKIRITYSYFWVKILFPMCWVFWGVILS